jgi:hypothetical protein
VTHHQFKKKKKKKKKKKENENRHTKSEKTKKIHSWQDSAWVWPDLAVNASNPAGRDPPQNLFLMPQNPFLIYSFFYSKLKLIGGRLIL